VGKTSLLATALYHTDQKVKLPGIDWSRCGGATVRVVAQHWQRLNTERWVRPTSEEHIDLDLTLSDGGIVRIRDVRGQITQEIQQPWVQEQLEEADAFLFLLEWRAREVARQIDAIRNSHQFWGTKPRALTFTKCERHLPQNHPAWSRTQDWWHGEEWCLRREDELKEWFDDRIWPSTAYGYSGSTGDPAIILSEFGQALPFGVRPQGVAAPLAYLLGELGVCRPGNEKG